MRVLLLALLLPALLGAGLVPVAVDAAAVDRVLGPRKRALIIGVSAYEDPLFTNLAYARADADVMAQVLSDRRYGGYDQVRRLVTPSETTTASIVAALDSMLASAGSEDTVLVYLSGHGTLDLDWQQQPELFLVATDTRRDDLPHTALRVRDIQDRIAASGARRKLLVIDACHHGAGKSKVAPETIARLRGVKGGAAPLLREPERGFEAYLFASTFGLPALEDPSLGHGVYTHYLAEGLSTERTQADRDGDGLVSVSEAHDYARDRTIAHTSAVQVPRAEYHIVGREELFLSGDETKRTAAQQALLFTFDDFYQRCSVTVDGRDMGMLPRGITLDPGEHLVTVTTPGGERLAEKRVRVDAGEVVDVASLHSGLRPERGRLGVAGGILGALGAGARDPYGGVLGGVAVAAGVSFPAHRALRAHLRLDGSWHGGRHLVRKGPAEFVASIHALRLRGTLGLQLRVARFGLVVGPTAGFMTALRFAADRAGPAAPHLLTWEAGAILEPSISIHQRLAVSLGLSITLTGADLNGLGFPAPVVYGLVQGGLTWTL